jgi:hypothetical protein
VFSLLLRQPEPDLLVGSMSLEPDCIPVLDSGLLSLIRQSVQGWEPSPPQVQYEIPSRVRFESLQKNLKCNHKQAMKQLQARRRNKNEIDE